VRGSIVAVHPAYPEVLHVEIQDPNGDLWRLATQDAEWFPSDPSQLVGQSVQGAELDKETGELRFALSGGFSFRVVPAEQEAEDDPPNWKLFTPEDLVLVFGPGGRWQFNRADESPGLPLGSQVVMGDLSARKSETLTQFLGEELASQLLLKERTLRNGQLFLLLSVGLSIISIVAAAISLALTLN
jgi:hypothetical protein